MSDSDPKYWKTWRNLQESLKTTQDVKSIPRNIDKVIRMENSHLKPYKVYENIDKLVSIKKKSKRAAGIELSMAKQSIDERDFFYGLRLHNQLLSVATPEYFGVAYAGRAVIYFELGMYNECIQNYDWAMTAGIEGLDDDGIKYLRSCQNKSYAELAKIAAYGEKSVQNFEVKLTGASHATLPFVSDGVKKVQSERFGRHLVATRDLAIGDVIVIEPAVCSVLGAGTKTMRCANCMRHHKVNLIPCPGCASAMFCSRACLEEANTNFHDIECKILEALHASMTVRQLVAVRLFIRGVKLFGTIDEFQRRMAQWQRNNLDAFSANYRHNDEQHRLAAVYNLHRVPEKARKSMDITGMAIATAVAIHLLGEYTAFKQLLEGREQRNRAIDLIYHYVQVVTTNARSSTTLCSRTEMDTHIHNEKDHVHTWTGWGIYTISPLMNHSCAPNVSVVRAGSDKIIVVSKPIKSGEQIYDSYGLTHMLLLLEDRKRQLMDRFNFKCKCLACQNDYPPYMRKQHYDGLPSIREASRQADALDWQYCKKHINFYQNYLAENPNYPANHTDHVTDVWQAMLQALVIDQHDMPLGYAQIADVLINGHISFSQALHIE